MNKEEKLGKILFITSIIALIYVSYIGFTKLGMWCDEIYSLGIIKSFSEFTPYLTNDVHPPLYYLIYEGFYKILGIDPILVGKFTSLLPFYLILTLAFTKVRKNWGWLTAGLFAFCIVTMPQLMNFAVELRMYSWGLFFVTASFIYANEITKNSNLKNWTILTILTIASAYTHYFSAIASFVIYLFLLLQVIENKKELKKYFTSAIIAIISFTPWLVILKQQVTSVSKDYWIAPITIDRVIGYVFFVFSPKNQVISANQIASFSILGLLLLIGVITLLIKNNKKEDSYGILIAICVPIIGIILSLLLRPVFHPRYIIPALGCLWLGVSIILSKNFNNKKIFIPILVIILLTASVSCVTFTQNQINEEINDNNKTQPLKDAFGSGNIILYDESYPYFIMKSYYLTDNHNFMLNVTEDKDFNTTANQISEVLQDPEIQNKIGHGNKIYFVNYKHYDNGITLNHDTYNLKKTPIQTAYLTNKTYEVELK